MVLRARADMNKMRYKIEKSRAKHKKYAAVFSDHRVNFGDTRYEHFKDQTPLKLYSKLDHHDPKRRASFLARHGPAKLHSANWFSQRFLW
jgi:hypothetical protein